MKNKKYFNLAFIKNRRAELKLTNQDMAENLGYKNGSTYLKYENGTYLFKADILPDLASALNCEVTDFFAQDVAVTAINEPVRENKGVC